jgi:hypothetical protein
MEALRKNIVESFWYIVMANYPDTVPEKSEATNLNCQSVRGKSGEGIGGHKPA